MSARDVIDAATDIACGVGNRYGGHIYTGADRDTIELGIRRLTAAGYRLLGPGKLDLETIERCAEVADTIGDQYDAAAFSRGDDVAVSACRHKETASHHIAAALRALQSQEAALTTEGSDG